MYKFLKVLEGLRHWELCNPDVAAAVEFCRARIVDMSIDEFEEWFGQVSFHCCRSVTGENNRSKDFIDFRYFVDNCVHERIVCKYVLFDFIWLADISIIC